MPMTLFDKIHLAELARQRAYLAVNDLSDPNYQERYRGEFDTALMWHSHRVYTEGSYSFVLR